MLIIYLTPIEKPFFIDYLKIGKPKMFYVRLK